MGCGRSCLTAVSYTHLDVYKRQQQSAALMAIMLRSMGAPAISFSGWQAGIFTGEQHGAAPIGLIMPGRLEAALDEGKIAVVAGFQGLSPLGDVTTLGRGGSDTTALSLIHI